MLQPRNSLSLVLLGMILLLSPFGAVRADLPDKPPSEVRKTFKTKLEHEDKADKLVDIPPRGLYDVIKYKSPKGDMSAYISPDPKDGKKHPIVIWVGGGFENSISSVAWQKSDGDDDESARVYHDSGLLMMYPSFRGGNKNPGLRELCLGEVDDLLAATDYVSKLPYVDATRIYLGGFDTGGTLAILAAESTDKYRCVFSFGPMASIGMYGQDVLPFDYAVENELLIRSPVAWLHYVKRPLFVFEGKAEPSNTEEMGKLIEHSKNPQIQFFQIDGATHTSVLGPVNKLIANKILQDTGTKTNISFTEAEVKAAFDK